MDPELSRPWAQNDPRLADDGRTDLASMEAECTHNQRAVRAVGFAQAHRFICQAEQSGGVGPVSESFPRVKSDEYPDSRVDIEVKAGLAFVARREGDT